MCVAALFFLLPLYSGIGCCLTQFSVPAGISAAFLECSYKASNRKKTSPGESTMACTPSFSHSHSCWVKESDTRMIDGARLLPACRVLIGLYHRPTISNLTVLCCLTSPEEHAAPWAAIPPPFEVSCRYNRGPGQVKKQQVLRLDWVIAEFSDGVRLQTAESTVIHIIGSLKVKKKKVQQEMFNSMEGVSSFTELSNYCFLTSHCILSAIPESYDAGIAQLSNWVKSEKIWWTLTAPVA